MSQLSWYLRKTEFNSPLPINTRINICKHITNMTYFKFNNKSYKQKYNLPPWEINSAKYYPVYF